MQPSLEKLRKFFRLEHENGYSNSAIIGGLAKMLDYWEGEARADGIQEEIIQAVVQRLRSYDGLYQCRAFCASFFNNSVGPSDFIYSINLNPA